MGTLQGILGFTITYAQVLVDDIYDRQELVLCCKISDINEWCQLKSKISAIRGGVSYEDRKINCLQVTVWWVTDLTLQGKIINLNNFKADIIADDIEESRLDFEDTRYGKGEVSKPKDFSSEKWSQWEDIIYN